jgi:hypothetical protein
MKAKLTAVVTAIAVGAVAPRLAAQDTTSGRRMHPDTAAYTPGSGVDTLGAAGQAAPDGGRDTLTTGAQDTSGMRGRHPAGTAVGDSTSPSGRKAGSSGSDSSAGNSGSDSSADSTSRSDISADSTSRSDGSAGSIPSGSSSTGVYPAEDSSTGDASDDTASDDSTSVANPSKQPGQSTSRTGADSSSP